VRLVPLMMKDGAVSDPMLPRKLAMEVRNWAHVCLSAGGISSSDSGISGVFILLDMLLQKQRLWVGGKCLVGERWWFCLGSLESVSGQLSQFREEDLP